MVQPYSTRTAGTRLRPAKRHPETTTTVRPDLVLERIYMYTVGSYYILDLVDLDLV